MRSNPSLIALEMNILNEDVDSKMPQLIAILKSKNSKHMSASEDKLRGYILRLAQSDPTPTQKNIVYFVTQFKFGNLRLEDAQRLGDALKYYFLIQRTPKLAKIWTGGKQPADYKDWHDLAREVNTFMAEHGKEYVPDVNFGEGTSIDRWKAMADLVLDQEIRTVSGNRKIEIYRINKPEAAVYYGHGTSWCTSKVMGAQHTRGGDQVWKGRPLERMKFADVDGYPITAKSYMGAGPLYIVFIDGKPTIQADSNFKQFKNPDDHEPTALSPFTDSILSRFYQLPEVAGNQAALDNIDRYRRKCVNPDYRGRIPLVSERGHQPQPSVQQEAPREVAQPPAQPAQPQQGRRIFNIPGLTAPAVP